MIAEISSLQHPLVKEWVKLRAEKSVRLASQSVFLIGEKMILELSRKITFKALITTVKASERAARERDLFIREKGLFAPYRSSESFLFEEGVFPILAEQSYLVTEEILQKITGLPSPDGFAAIAELPSPQSLSGKQRILILDRLSDPGNLGTLLRTALALDWDGVLLTPETVDPFNDKALRASKGALFSLPYNWLSPSEVTAFLQSEKIPIYLADLTGSPLLTTPIPMPIALILSNEAAGPSPWAEKIGQKISIPMHNGVDSLNVAASGAIFLFTLGYSSKSGNITS